jgi:ZIP family zinc transporter
MLGIGLQNLPEGMAVSLPLLRDGYSRRKAFFIGQLSGVVEPIAAVLGALFVAVAQPILPAVLGLAAGAMIYVVVEDVIPESQSSGHGNAATVGCILGFVVMMVLDTVLAA